MDTESIALGEAERLLGFNLPARHRQAVLDANDPIHEACEFLLPVAAHRMQRLIGVNDFLRSAYRWKRWPDFLVAFASNGCGDYFAYDLRASPPEIVYMDPFRTVEEDLTVADRLVYESFEAWYADQLTSEELG